MSSTPEDFLAHAEDLSSCNKEIADRSCISRAYYACYHYAQQVFPLDKASAKGSTVGVHETYLNQLMQAEPNSEPRKVAVKLSALKGRRNKADYDICTDIKAGQKAMQLSQAREVFAILGKTEPEQIGIECCQSAGQEAVVEGVVKSPSFRVVK